MENRVLELLERSEDYLSGERMSEELGITRAAVWKQVKRLRERGYEIEAVTNLGYRLISAPEGLDGAAIRAQLEDCPWGPLVTMLDTVGSTNNLAKRQAVEGAPHGSVYIADEQTGGRGRQGRGFLSKKGQGIYLSALLRPACAPAELSHVTAMAAVAVCDAVEQVCGVRPGIKWMNDLLLGEKKFVGILSELSVEWESGTLEYLVIGVGVNCAQRPEDFPEELRSKATSLYQFLGKRPDRNRLAAELVKALHRLSEELLTEKPRWMARYAADCVTLGRQVRVLRGDSVRTGTATGVDDSGALLVRYDGGETGVVFTGEVSVRGVDGYL